MRDGLVSYDFSTSEVYGLSEETVQSEKCVRDVD